MIFYLLNKLLVFVIPVLSLLFSSIFYSYNHYIVANLSIVLIVYHSILLFFTLLLPTIWETYNFVIELPLLISVFSFSWYIPAGVTDFYIFLLNWVGPVLILLQAYQSINLILFTNRTLMDKTIDPAYDVPIKVAAIITSLISYIFSIYIFYKLFTDVNLTTFNSSLLSVVVTLLLILIPFMLFVEDSMLLDIAMISLFVALQCFTYFYTGESTRFSWFINLVSVIVSLITLLSFTLTMGRSDSSSFTENSLFGDLEQSDNKESIYQLVHIILIVALTYFPLSYFGHIETVSKILPSLQIIIQFVLYTLSCLQNSNLIKLHED